MNKKRAVLLISFVLLLLAACSNDEEMPEAEVEEEELEISDEALIAVVETNIEQLMAKDFDGYMATIHSDSPVYDATSETVDELFNYTLAIELSHVQVKEKSAEKAVVAYAQRTIKEEGPAFQNNETIGEHVLKPEEDGTWKIYQSEVSEINPIEEVAEEEEPIAEEVPLEGDYAEPLAEIDHPFDNEDWVLVTYDEGDGEARLEYISPNENLGNYTEIFTIEFYEDGNELSGINNFIDVFEANLKEITTGELSTNREFATESEVIYTFSLTDDEEQADQEEVGRVFVKDNDIYVARYTVIDDTIENQVEIIDLLNEIE